MKNKNCGVMLLSSDFNMIHSNIIKQNDNFGIKIMSSDNNTIYNNYFSSNQENAKDISLESNGNQWFHENITSQNIIYGPIIAGNYWNDYVGVDENRDGLGDSPYIIEGGDKSDERPIVYRRPLADAGGPYSGSVFESILFDGAEVVMLMTA